VGPVSHLNDTSEFFIVCFYLGASAALTLLSDQLYFKIVALKFLLFEQYTNWYCSSYTHSWYYLHVL